MNHIIFAAIRPNGHIRGNLFLQTLLLDYTRTKQNMLENGVKLREMSENEIFCIKYFDKVLTGWLHDYR